VEDISLDADFSTAVFRIFQETLNNVARHSGATEVHVRLCADADSSTLEVEDNGATLRISGKTVSSYRSRILEKMKMSTNADLTRYALEHHLV
jgi:signal transduction histidine kinase